MPNALYREMNPTESNPFSQIKSEFEKFKASFKGDPQQEVQRLLNTGQMTQAQYNQLARTAQQMRSMFS